MSYQNKRRILVTSALPYANGSLHLGHLLEHIQTDIWVRYQKSKGHECHYICADDTHGTAIMLKAEEEGKTPEQLIADIHKEHSQDLKDFLICHDHYYTTHSDENRFYSEYIFHKLLEKNLISTKSITQAYDPVKEIFLADRYIKGTCPKCGAENQYGDNCEVCAATYSPSDLINPRSTISGEKPINKTSEHYFFKLTEFESFLNDWLKNKNLQLSVKNKLSEWLKSGLQEWDISRDAPYFGFKIPNTSNKYFYVWLDAPIGYIASFKNYCLKENINFDEFWVDNTAKQNETELYHFIGKDIINFHGLFWPAMLNASGFRLPDAIFAHGFLTINGEKMSKSRGTFIKARQYLDFFEPEYIRYFFASKLSNSVEDIDLNMDDFIQKINSDLVGKLINIPSRCANFIYKKFDCLLASTLPNPELQNSIIEKNTEISEAYENREFSKVIRIVMSLADIINQYIDETKPWVIAKEPGREEELQCICSQAIRGFSTLMIYLKPILPELTKKSESFLNTKLNWENLEDSLYSHKINKFKPLVNRIDKRQVDEMLLSIK